MDLLRRVKEVFDEKNGYKLKREFIREVRKPKIDKENYVRQVFSPMERIKRHNATALRYYYAHREERLSYNKKWREEQQLKARLMEVF